MGDSTKSCLLIIAGGFLAGQCRGQVKPTLLDPYDAMSYQDGDRKSGSVQLMS